MTFGESIRKNLTSSYADFSGSASRSEFWWFALFALLVGVVATALDGALGGNSRQKPVLNFLACLVLFLPYAGLSWRRVADVGLPGWISLVPTIAYGFYVLILAGSLTEGKPLDEDEEIGLSIIYLVLCIPFILIWCLPGRNVPKEV